MEPTLEGDLKTLMIKKIISFKQPVSCQRGGIKNNCNSKVSALRSNIYLRSSHV
jgi:hypothetical protein